MTLKKIIRAGADGVYLRSYGYTEKSLFASVWQPFSKAREIFFSIDSENELYNPTYWPEDKVELDDEFNYINGKYVSVRDYDLCSKEAI